MEMMAFGNLIKHHLLRRSITRVQYKKKKENVPYSSSSSSSFLCLFQESADRSPYELGRKGEEEEEEEKIPSISSSSSSSSYFLLLLLIRMQVERESLLD